MAKFLKNKMLIAHAKEYYEQNHVARMLAYLVDDFDIEQLSVLYIRFDKGEWSEEEGHFIDFYPLYYMGTIEELARYFICFLYDYSNMPEKKVTKVAKLLKNKINEFLELAQVK